MSGFYGQRPKRGSVDTFDLRLGGRARVSSQAPPAGYIPSVAKVSRRHVAIPTFRLRYRAGEEFALQRDRVPLLLRFWLHSVGKTARLHRGRSCDAVERSYAWFVGFVFEGLSHASE